jgi:hypothetical protein
MLRIFVTLLAALALLAAAGCTASAPSPDTARGASATEAEIRAAWNVAAGMTPDVEPVAKTTPLATALTQLVSGGQSVLDTHLGLMEAELDASARPDIDLDSGTLGDVYSCAEFTGA